MDMDPFGIVPSFIRVLESWKDRYADFLQISMNLLENLEEATIEELPSLTAAVNKALEMKDPKAAMLDYVRCRAGLHGKHHNILNGWLKEFVGRAQGLNEEERKRALFWTRQITSAMAPANFFWTNPFAVQKFLNSDGETLIKGSLNWLDDAFQRDFLTRIVDESVFKVGDNIASTPGKIIFRNDLIELIQYKPSTEKTYAVPIVLIPPWINKYYIFDLTPESSLVRYLRDQGFTVFIISWKNPSGEMRHVTFEDYIFKGILKAIDVAMLISGVPQVHAAGYCIGGTALAVLMAWLNRSGKEKAAFPVVDWTLFSALVDFAEPGELGVLINRNVVETVEQMMEITGVLDKKLIGLTFRLLGADNLIWRNFVHNYLYGGSPPKSDMLFWNSDGTNLPQAMCSFYLREFYLNNSLAKSDRMVMSKRPIDMNRVTQPLYVVGTQMDHICPWRSTFQTCRLVSGSVKYVLSSEGHITGIINPPSPYSRRKYWAGNFQEETQPEVWLSSQVESHGSWWGDWVEWMKYRSMPMTGPPHIGCNNYPPLEDAPGIYVTEH
ncbi:MAG: polyhydroxyalkanoate synthase subunit PhaC [Syntrophus sp. SKADARSKE-3]|nr:polyhydroxyalkanoate synthase subunit PhaC [Syntrophus sp. SKADARSKE-3]